jgi:hypothetical protein
MLNQNVHTCLGGLMRFSKIETVKTFAYFERLQGIFPAIIAIFLLMVTSCNNSAPPSSKIKENKTTVPQVKVPDFNADSAYYFVKGQLDFGPRVPMTKAHDDCALWLENSLKRFTPNVIVQDFKARIYDGRIIEGKNIIAAFNPQSKNRVFLCSHWDSRPFADHDPDPSNKNKPIAGANDGASGTGVLLEIARQLSKQNPNIGIDIILFDLEDFGPPEDKQTNQGADTWGLGSQYWSKNPHIFGYTARYGILLDMVGAPDAKFPMEAFSMYYAPDVVKKVWDVAKGLGYDDYFVYEKGGYITDDHYFINQLAQIPTIDIIHLNPNSANGTFYDHWHTIQDDLSQIDRETLKVVGQTVLTVIYQE